jgi:hypothetical protein
MEVGDLVTVRLGERSGSRHLTSGVIVGKYVKQERLYYDVLCEDSTVTVTDLDIGPIDIYTDKDRLERRWNECSDV